MNQDQVKRFFEHLHNKAKELVPEYPGVNNDQGFPETQPYEHLYSITVSLEGCNAALKDWEEFVRFLCRKLNMTYEKALKLYQEVSREQMTQPSVIGPTPLG